MKHRKYNRYTFCICVGVCVCARLYVCGVCGVCVLCGDRLHHCVLCMRCVGGGGVVVCVVSISRPMCGVWGVGCVYRSAYPPSTACSGHRGGSRRFCGLGDGDERPNA